MAALYIENYLQSKKNLLNLTETVKKMGYTKYIQVNYHQMIFTSVFYG